MSKGGPKGINWEAALEYYLTPKKDEGLPSYQDVANRFNVSKKEVGLRAKHESWVQRRQNVYDEAQECFVDNKTELIKKTTRKHIGHWREIQDAASEMIKEINEEIQCEKTTDQTIKNLLQISSIFKVAIEGERTALGIPNSFKGTMEQIDRRETVLSPETIDQIDRMFELNAQS